MGKSNNRSHRLLGYTTELEAVERAESMGYFVMRSAGSRGPMDIIAINQHLLLGAQIKHADFLRNVLVEYHEDLERLINVSQGLNMTPMLWVKVRRGTWHDYVLVDSKLYTAYWSCNEPIMDEFIGNCKITPT